MNPLTKTKINEPKTCNTVYEKAKNTRSNQTNKTVQKPLENCNQSSSNDINKEIKPPEMSAPNRGDNVIKQKQLSTDIKLTDDDSKSNQVHKSVVNAINEIILTNKTVKVRENYEND